MSAHFTDFDLSKLKPKTNLRRLILAKPLDFQTRLKNVLKYTFLYELLLNRR